MYFSPSSGQKKVGATFSVNVYASSADQAANAFLGAVSFPSNLLQVTSLGKSGSIMSLWVQEPSFSNSAGSVSFEGVVLNPGFTGSGGKLLTINFKVKAAGDGAVTFSNGSVLANDGQGTNILAGLGSANFELLAMGAPTEEAAPIAAPVVSGAPAAPRVSSSNFPDQNKWYNAGSPQFEWQVPGGTTGVSVALNQKPFADPGTRSDGSMSFIEYSNAVDGVSYFHIRLRNSNGWGKITHFRVQKDTASPAPFTVDFSTTSNTTSVGPSANFSAIDALSGLDYYKIQIDNAEPVQAVAGPYDLSKQIPGEHHIVVQAVDKAGNIQTAPGDFTVKQIAPPEFTEYKEFLRSREIMVIKGRTYPNLQVTLHMAKDGEEPVNIVVMSDHWGDFTFVGSRGAESGVYKIWADVSDGHELKSEASRAITIAVGQTAVARFILMATDYLKIIIPVLILLIAFGWFALHAWKKILDLKKSLRKEVREVEEVVSKSFAELSSTIKEQMQMLERAKKIRALTKEESAILSGFKRILRTTEAAEKKLIKIEKKSG